jgi:adenosylcobinamide-phosphate synthase
MLLSHHAALILACALLLDAALGDPGWLWRRAPHPIVLMGRLIGWLDDALNRGARDWLRRAAGVAALALVITITGGVALALHFLFAQHSVGVTAEAVTAAILLAQRNLYDHVAAVESALREGGLIAGREAVSQIVGRDPNALDESGVCSAAIETLAENFSDGIVAPAFWYLIAGLPGIAIYKAVNTADSMIGHRTPHHEAFGWGAARLDDLANLIPARLSGLLTTIAAAIPARGNVRRAWTAMLRDAPRHRSPNAGWPEAAMAGALGIAIGGPRSYASQRLEAVRMNEGARPALTPADIRRALRLFLAACAVQFILVLGLALAAM